MSTEVEGRRLRKRSKNNETPLKLSKSMMTSGNSERKKLNSGSIIGFNSETLSSSSAIKVDTNSEKRFNKKRIRGTQEFNQLSSSFTSHDPEETTKNKSKKTKKSKKAYNLPRISKLAEDLCSNSRNIFSDDDLVRNKRTKMKNKKHVDRKMPLESNYENKTNDEKDKVKGVDETFKISANFKQILTKENTSDGSVTDEYQSASSILLDSQKESDDEEIVIKKKRKLRKKKCNESHINVDVEGENTDTARRYADKIGKLLNDTFSRSSKSNSTSNPSALSTPLIDRKSEQSKRISTKHIKPAITPKSDKLTVSSDNQEVTGKQSLSKRRSRKIYSTPCPKTKISNNLIVDFKENRKKSDTPRRSRTAELESTKAKNKNKIFSTFTVNVSFDMDYDSDDVFNTPSEKKLQDSQNTESNQAINILNTDTSRKTRKSVRFQSPEENIRRETIVLSNPITGEMIIVPKECDDDVTVTRSISEVCRSSTDAKRNSTFELTSPKVNFSRGMSQDLLFSSDSVHIPNISYKSCEANTSNLSNGKCSTELLTPINKNLRKYKNEKDHGRSLSNSIIDLVSPTPLNKISSAVTPKSEQININGSVNTSAQLNRQSTFSKDDGEGESVAPQVEDNVPAANASSFVPNLVRTATFIKDDEAVNQSADLPPDLKYSSPLPSDTSYSKIIDTSKVNKRRRWDKSRLSVSFLNDSLDIGNTSAPWHEDSIRNLRSLEASPLKKSPEEKSVLQINSPAKKVSFRNCATPPSGTSTPFPARKSTLLRQALLKQGATVSERKNLTMQKEKCPPKSVRTKIPNFALIHQRAYDKLENIKEMSERKAARARLLLSGHKPPTDTQKTSTRRKELKFNSPIKSSSSNNNIPKSSAKFSPAPLKSSSSNENKNMNRSDSKSNISIAKIKKLSPSKSNLKVTNKENKSIPIMKKELLKGKSLVPKPKLPNKVVAEKKGFTRFGFKIGPERVKNTTKEEQVKAVATKSKIMKDSLDERRNEIRGVRSNRRFDLLMKMRAK